MDPYSCLGSLRENRLGPPRSLSGDPKGPHGPPGLGSGRLMGAGLEQPRALGAGPQGVSGAPIAVPGLNGKGREPPWSPPDAGL